MPCSRMKPIENIGQLKFPKVGVNLIREREKMKYLEHCIFHLYYIGKRVWSKETLLELKKDIEELLDKEGAKQE